MAGQETVQPKKRGPKPTGVGTPIQVRLQPEQLAVLDKWIGAQAQNFSRPEAIRHLVDIAINGDEFSQWLADGKL